MAAGAQSLVRLIFRSRSVAQPGSADLQADTSAIIRSSRANNPGHDITGVLLFDDLFFMQVLEGPSSKVELLYEVIARDMRHEAIEVIDFLPAETREYAGLSLGYLHVTQACFPELRQMMSRAVQGVAPALGTMISEALAKQRQDVLF